MKLGNLFLTDKMELKVGDFGLATKLEFEGDKKRTICGTPNYIAPEIIDGKTGHSYEVDIWSLGVILYTLLIGKPPFETSDVKTTYKRIKMNAYNFPDNITISTQAKKLISKILNLDPSKRPTLDQILEDPFFRMGNSIPTFLPASTLACPPSSSYIRQFVQNGVPTADINVDRPRLESTAPILASTLKEAKSTKSVNPSLMGTEKISLKPAVASTAKIATAKGIELCSESLVSDPTDIPKSETVCIKKWVDYSSKYGIGTTN